MKQLSSFMVLNINGGNRVSYTYEEIDDVTGEPTKRNNKKSFYVVDPELIPHIDAIQEYIRNNKLEE